MSDIAVMKVPLPAKGERYAKERKKKGSGHAKLLYY